MKFCVNMIDVRSDMEGRRSRFDQGGGGRDAGSAGGRVRHRPDRRAAGAAGHAASGRHFEKTKTTFRRHAPRVGKDGVEVLREAGLSDAQIEALKANGALVLP